MRENEKERHREKERERERERKIDGDRQIEKMEERIERNKNDQKRTFV